MNPALTSALAGIVQAIVPGLVGYGAAAGWLGANPNTAAITAAVVTLISAAWSGFTTKLNAKGS